MSIMEAISTFPLWSFALLLPAIPIFILFSDIYTWYHLPPGPLPLPFIGNLLSLRKQNLLLQFQHWQTIYGPIFTVYVGRRPTIIISDPSIAYTLLETRSKIYSSRPRLVVLGTLFTRWTSIISLPYSFAWIARRKLLHHALKPSALHTYKARQEAEASKLVFQLLNDGEKWAGAIDRFAASVVFSISYGRRVDSLNAEVVKKRLAFMQYVSMLVVPGKYLAEMIPVLAKLPDWLVPWKKQVRDMGDREAEFNIGLVEVVKSDMRNRKRKGLAEDSGLGNLTETLLNMEDIDKGPVIERMDARTFAAIPGTLFNAGSDTSGCTLRVAILALLTHPHVLAIAYSELLSISSFNINRTPSFSDRPNLPYIDALVQEILRWRPVVALGLFHATTASDVYENWQIPKGTNVLANSYAINTHPLYFPLPDIFEPARFLPHSDPRFKPEFKGKAFPGRFGQSGFGWGRRACVGAELAENSIWIAVVKMVWAFELRKMEREIYNTDMESFMTGTIFRPMPFRVQWMMRSEVHRSVLEREIVSAREVLERFAPFE